MSVSFSAVDHTRMRTLDFGRGAFQVPTRIELDAPGEEFNMNNGNTCLLFGLLGFRTDDLCGEASLPECRRAIMQARARFEHVAHKFTREEEVVFGAPCENADGTVEMRPMRSFSMGFGKADLRRRLDMFERFVDRATAAGATAVTWG